MRIPLTITLYKLFTRVFEFFSLPIFVLRAFKKKEEWSRKKERFGFINFEDYKILDKKVKIGETGVDIDSQIEMEINKNIIVKLSSSFQKNLGLKTEIHGSKGIIKIPNTWTGSPNIILEKGNIKKKLKTIN